MQLLSVRKKCADAWATLLDNRFKGAVNLVNYRTILMKVNNSFVF